MIAKRTVLPLPQREIKLKPTPLNVAQIRLIEREGLRKGLPLIERAGHCAARFVHAHCEPCKDILLLVGPGNNGADALMTGTHLLQAGKRVSAIMPVAPASSAHEALQVLGQWRALGQTTLTELPLGTHPDLVIDGLFGIGLNRPLTDPWQALVDQINTLQLPVLSLDIPSGLAADSGQCLGRPIAARWTIAFIAPTLALYDETRTDIVGEWDVCTLGLPE